MKFKIHLINYHFFSCVQWHSRGNTLISSKATSWGLQSDLHPARWLATTCTHWKPVLPSPSPSLRAAMSCVRSSAPTQQPSSSHPPPPHRHHLPRPHPQILPPAICGGLLLSTRLWGLFHLWGMHCPGEPLQQDSV